MTYNAEKKSYTVSCGEKNFFLQRFGKKLLPQLNHPYPPPPQRSNSHVNHLGGGGRNGFDTLVNVIHQQNDWRAFIMWWFSRLKFCIQDWKYTDKRHIKNEKRKFNGMLSFLFVDKRKLFGMKFSFEEFNLVSTRRIVALCQFWTNQGNEDSEETCGTFCTLWSRKVRF